MGVAVATHEQCVLLPKQFGYACEKYAAAVRLLATQPGDVRSRLRRAAAQVCRISPAFVPEVTKIRSDVVWVLAQLSKHNSRYPGQSRLDATLDRIRNTTATRIAERILNIHVNLDGLSYWTRPCARCGSPR